MVARTLVKLSTPMRKIDLALPGLNTSSLKKYPSLLPLHFFTLLGAGFAAWYCGRLLYVKDVVLNKHKPARVIQPNDKIGLFSGSIDVKNLTKPEKRPELPVE